MIVIQELEFFKDFDVIQSEADFLIATSDKDGSNTLSKEEVLKGKFNLFG